MNLSPPQDLLVHQKDGSASTAAKPSRKPLPVIFAHHRLIAYLFASAILLNWLIP